MENEKALVAAIYLEIVYQLYKLSEIITRVVANMYHQNPKFENVFAIFFCNITSSIIKRYLNIAI